MKEGKTKIKKKKSETAKPNHIIFLLSFFMVKQKNSAVQNFGAFKNKKGYPAREN